MKLYTWNEEKNEWLKAERNISFEEVLRQYLGVSMRTNNLDTEERGILESYERGEWQSIGTLQERQKYQAYAVAAVGIKGQISISLPIEDLRVVQLNLEIRVTHPVDYVRQEEN